MLPDGALVSSEITHALLRWLIEDPPDPGDHGSEKADTIVRGMEVVLWLAWLKQTQALGKGPVTAVPGASSFTRVGGVWRSMHVTALRHTDGTPRVRTPDPLPVLADGYQYPGLLALADGHGRYLYYQFAREFFMNNPGLSPDSLKFDAARYEGVDMLPDGQDRTDRLAEMKLLAIVYFRTLEAGPTTIGSGGDPLVDRTRATLRTLLEISPEQNIVTAFLSSQPPTNEPSGELPQATAPLDPAQAAIDAAAAERLARDDTAKLAIMVTDLDLLISQAPPMPVDESAGLVERFAAEDAKFAIEQKQQAVSDQYDTFIEHAAGQTALIDEVNADYYARIEQLLAWPAARSPVPLPHP